MRYKHIVFDLDGTLIDTERAILPSLRDTLEELTGRHYEEQALTFALGITGADALKQLGIADIPTALSLWNEKMHRYGNSVSLFGGVVEALTKLWKQRLVLGIVTSKTREEFAHDFSKFGIGSYFQTVVCAEDTVEHKPSPAPLLKYMELSGAHREKALYVGDSIYDSQCAHAAGVDFALALWGTHDPAIPAQHRIQMPRHLLTLSGGQK